MNKLWKRASKRHQSRVLERCVYVITAGLQGWALIVEQARENSVPTTTCITRKSCGKPQFCNLANRG